MQAGIADSCAQALRWDVRVRVPAVCATRGIRLRKSLARQQRTFCLAALLGLLLPGIATSASTKPFAAGGATPSTIVKPGPVLVPPAAATGAQGAAGAPIGDASGIARLEEIPNLDEPQIRLFIEDIAVELSLVKGYRKIIGGTLKLPPVPENVAGVLTLVRHTEPGTHIDVIRLGYMIIARRLPRLWIYGTSGAGQTQMRANPDSTAEGLNPLLAKLYQARSKLLNQMPVARLQPQVIKLSYTDADGALVALRAMGFSAITEDVGLPVDTSYKGNDVAWLADVASVAAAAPKVSIAPRAGETADSGKPPSPFGAAAPANPGGSPFGGSPFGGSPGGSPFDGSPGGSPFGGSPGGSPFGGSPGGSPVGGSPGGSPFGGGPGGGGAPLAAKRFLNVPTAVNYDQLPLIMKMPTPPPQETGLVGVEAPQATQNSLGLTQTPAGAASLGSTNAGGTQQLLLLYDPHNVEQFAKVRRVINELIDKPARQVFVEGLVLEISRQGIQELGIQWQTNSSTSSLQLGVLTQLTPGTGQSALSFMRNPAGGFNPAGFLATVKALVDRNLAEVLSRPSVLTLDNRQATIRVGKDIPIATSKDAGTGSAGGRVSLSFNYLPTGIQLNVRPRVNEAGTEISMLVDATVSSTVPGEDLRVVDPTNGSLLASAPTISQRRVQTYARIVNNTPLIIGGLVSRDLVAHEDKVPGLGDIPLLGKLFGYESRRDGQREVIIVLTPSVLTEEFRATKPQIPRDSDYFDAADTTLFRTAYRIRAEDLIDSQYIRFNQRLLAYRKIVNEVISRDPNLANVAPFGQFHGQRVPGEFIFVAGMMSRMLTRLKIANAVNVDRLTFFEGVHGASFKKETVGGILRRMGDGQSIESFFGKNPGKALLLKFSDTRLSMKPGEWVSEPQAQIELVDCPNREVWRKLLWEKNQPVDGVYKHYTMVIHDPSDLERLRLAIALKNTILNNGNVAGTIFDNFLPGRMLAMQEIAPEWERILDASAARYFFIGELFYPAFFEAHEKALRDVDVALRKPEIQPLLGGIKLP